ncbi:MAG: ATP F0F1 synthase subunit B, partial [Aestuariivirga sp.]
RKLSETIERRSKQAEQKIAQAEASAMKDVRDLATELAIKAASQLSAEAAKGTRGAKLVDDSIAAIKSRLN